jgi:hypothetical protein
LGTEEIEEEQWAENVIQLFGESAVRGMDHINTCTEGEEQGMYCNIITSLYKTSTERTEHVG